MAEASSEEQVGTEPSTNRIEAFSDGGVALAIARGRGHVGVERR